MICSPAIPQKLRVCSWCSGAAFEPTEESVPCLNCDGGGFEIAKFDLGPTATYAERPVEYNPGNRILTVFRKGRSEQYRIAEFAADQETNRAATRAFQFEKLSDGTLYNVEYGVGIHSCDCPGCTYEASEKWLKGAWGKPADQTYFTLGCVHLDFVFWAMAAGLFDLGIREEQGCYFTSNS